jgi:hypothetical protein
MFTKIDGLEAAKAAVLAGKRVYWGDQSGYELLHSARTVGGWVIECAGNKHTIAVYYRDGVSSDYTDAVFCTGDAS